MQNARFMGFLDLMAKWNKTCNLTSITDPERMITHHLLDSLSIWRYLKGNTLIDVGTGAGLPGVPLAIIRPALQVCLLDSSGKRCRFLTQVRIELALDNIEIERSRVQDYQDRQFQTVICRAYGSLEGVATQLEPLLASGGQLLAMRGKVLRRELSSLPKTIKVLGVHQLAVPFMAEQRNLVVMGKAL
jgi:16S rRNA (guanine527-N7)-methyltransferase